MVEPAPLKPLPVAGSPEEKFREFLEIRGEKLTEPRRVLVRHIFDSHKHFDADELVSDLRGAGRKVSRATVYRTLRLLVDAGLLRELRLTNRTAYEHDYGYPSHDHLHCTGCDRIIEFNDDEVRRIREAVSQTHGFLAPATASSSPVSAPAAAAPAARAAGWTSSERRPPSAGCIIHRGYRFTQITKTNSFLVYFFLRLCKSVSCRDILPLMRQERLVDRPRAMTA